MSAASTGVPSRRWQPRFSLAALFVLVTLAAIGSWYWYQLPFEVRNVTYSQSVSKPDPFAPVGAPPLIVAGQVIRLEIESVRRVWSRDKPTIRHGPWKVYDGRDVLLAEGHYRNGGKHGRFAQYSPTGQPQSESHYVSGQLHGRSRRWIGKGVLLEETNYDRGAKHGRYFRADHTGQPVVDGTYAQDVPAGKWTWSCWPGDRRRKSSATIVGQWLGGLPDGLWTCKDASDQVYLTAEFDRGRIVKSSAGQFELRLAQLLAQGKLAEPQAVCDLLKPVSYEFEAAPLLEAMQLLAEESQASLFVGLRDDLSAAELARLFPPKPPKPPTYVLPLSASTRLLIPVDETAPLYQIELELPASAIQSDEPTSIPARDWPLTGAGRNVPLIVALDRLLSPHTLTCDYRYGVLWIERASSLPTWTDPTGVSQLKPPAGSYLAETWNRPDPIGIEFVGTPLKDALAYMCDVHGGGLKLNFTQFPPPTSGPVPMHNRRADIDSPVTITARGLPLKHSLGLLLELTGCQATLRGETIVVAPQDRK